MENEEEKSEEKMMFLVVWSMMEKMKDSDGTHQFSLLPSKTQSLQIEEKIGVKVGQNCPHFLFIITIFFFWQPHPGVINVACLPFFLSFFSFGFHSFTGC